MCGTEREGERERERERSGERETERDRDRGRETDGKIDTEMTRLSNRPEHDRYQTCGKKKEDSSDYQTVFSF